MVPSAVKVPEDPESLEVMLDFVKNASSADLKRKEENRKRRGFKKSDPKKRMKALKIMIMLLEMPQGKSVRFEGIDRHDLYTPLYSLHKELGVNKDDDTNSQWETSCLVDENTKFKRYTNKKTGKQRGKTPVWGNWVVTRLDIPSEQVLERCEELRKSYRKELLELTKKHA